jgi:hypothetical protein
MTIYNNYIQENKLNDRYSLGNFYKFPALNNRLLKTKIKKNFIKNKTITLDCGLKTPYKALPYELNSLRAKNRIISTKNINLEDNITLQFNGITPSDDILLNSPKDTLNKASSDVVETIQRLKDLKRIFLRKKTLKGRILKPVRGGFSVAINGFIGFLPNSHLIKERSPSLNDWQNKTKVLLGRELNFRILSLKQFKKPNQSFAINIVLSYVEQTPTSDYYNNIFYKNNSKFLLIEDTIYRNNKIFGNKLNSNKNFEGFIPTSLQNSSDIYKLIQINLPEPGKYVQKPITILLPIENN